MSEDLQYRNYQSTLFGTACDREVEFLTLSNTLSTDYVRWHVFLLSDKGGSRNLAH